VCPFPGGGRGFAPGTPPGGFGYGLFTGGFGLHYGLEKVAPASCRASTHTERQLMLMQDMQTQVLICTPSYALHIAEVIREKKIARQSLALSFAHSEPNRGPRICDGGSNRSLTSSRSITMG